MRGRRRDPGLHRDHHADRQADLDLPVFDTTRIHAEAAMDFSSAPEAAPGCAAQSASGLLVRSAFTPERRALLSSRCR